MTLDHESLSLVTEPGAVEPETGAPPPEVFIPIDSLTPAMLIDILRIYTSLAQIPQDNPSDVAYLGQRGLYDLLTYDTLEFRAGAYLGDWKNPHTKFRGRTRRLFHADEEDPIICVTFHVDANIDMSREDEAPYAPIAEELNQRFKQESGAYLLQTGHGRVAAEDEILL